MNFIMYFFSLLVAMFRRTSVIIVWIIILSGVAPVLHAQQVSVSATVDTNSILTGQQFILHLQVKHPSDAMVDWPAVPDTFALFEIVQQLSSDTVNTAADNSITKQQHYKITSFDSGYHVIPPFTFKYNLKGDTAFVQLSTAPILIHVQSIAVDTTRSIKDIKATEKVPFTWRDAVPYAGGLLFVALLVLIIYYLIRKFRKKPVQPVIEIVKRPAHEIALEALQQLEAAKLWQQGKYKAYYTGLADITRMFIQNRWSVAAMEMTTDEILALKIIYSQQPDVFEKVKNMLELSDLVKFAKMIPVLHENEQSMKHAIAFVQANRPVTEIKEVTS